MTERDAFFPISLVKHTPVFSLVILLSISIAKQRQKYNTKTTPFTTQMIKREKEETKRGTKMERGADVSREKYEFSSSI